MIATGEPLRRRADPVYEARLAARRRVARVWNLAVAVFFGSLVFWFFAFVAGLFRRVAPWM